VIFAIAAAAVLRQQHLRSNRLLLDAHARSDAGGLGGRIRAIASGTDAAY
jgi:hypothetical protein